MNDSNNIQAAIEAGTRLAGIQYIGSISGAPVVVVPAGYDARILDLAKIEQFLPKPARKRGTFKFGDVDSFVRYFGEHKNDSSRIFAELTDSGASFKGILNFHGSDASFNDHICQHTLESTVEWKRWMGSNKVKMSQVEFATFLEENADLFKEPSGAAFLELIRDLEGHANISVNSSVKLENGAIKLQYDEEVLLKGSQTTTQSGEMDIPSVLSIAVAPFRGLSPFPIKARLRYRIESRKLLFWYETIDAHKLVETVCKSVMDIITEKTLVQPFVS